MGQRAAAQGLDTNGTVAALLRDLASVQTSQHSRWGYKRAAAAIRNLEAPIESFLQADGTLRKIPHVGPSSTRVIMEVLNTGHSEIVERQIAASGRTSEVEKSRALRGRMYGSRPGIAADWHAVFAAAARANVAIEIDGDPARQDVDYDLARLAEVPADRVVNCWPLDRLLEWAKTAWERSGFSRTVTATTIVR